MDLNPDHGTLPLGITQVEGIQNSIEHTEVFAIFHVHRKNSASVFGETVSESVHFMAVVRKTVPRCG